MYECLYCGSPLDKHEVCTNLNCQACPKGYLLHSHLEDRSLCTDPTCPDHEGTLYITPQAHCCYCVNPDI